MFNFIISNLDWYIGIGVLVGISVYIIRAEKNREYLFLGGLVTGATWPLLFIFLIIASLDRE